MCAKFKWGVCVQKNIKKDLAKTSMLAVLQMQDAMQKLSLMLFKNNFDVLLRLLERNLINYRFRFRIGSTRI